MPASSSVPCFPSSFAQSDSSSSSLPPLPKNLIDVTVPNPEANSGSTHYSKTSPLLRSSLLTAWLDHNTAIKNKRPRDEPEMKEERPVQRQRMTVSIPPAGVRGSAKSATKSAAPAPSTSSLSSSSSSAAACSATAALDSPVAFLSAPPFHDCDHKESSSAGLSTPNSDSFAQLNFPSPHPSEVIHVANSVLNFVPIAWRSENSGDCYIDAATKKDINAYLDMAAAEKMHSFYTASQSENEEADSLTRDDDVASVCSSISSGYYQSSQEEEEVTAMDF